MCSITLLATEIALLISFKQPTAPTSWVSLQQHEVGDHHVTDHVILMWLIMWLLCDWSCDHHVIDHVMSCDWSCDYCAPTFPVVFLLLKWFSDQIYMRLCTVLVQNFTKLAEFWSWKFWFLWPNFAGPNCPLQDSNMIEDVWKEKKCLPIHDHCIESCLPFLIRTNGEMTHVKPEICHIYLNNLES